MKHIYFVNNLLIHFFTWHFPLQLWTGPDCIWSLLECCHISLMAISFLADINILFLSFASQLAARLDRKWVALGHLVLRGTLDGSFYHFDLGRMAVTSETCCRLWCPLLLYAQNEGCGFWQSDSRRSTPRRLTDNQLWISFVCPGTGTYSYLHYSMDSEGHQCKGPCWPNTCSFAASGLASGYRSCY